MNNKKTAKQLSMYYRDMHRKGVEELPLDNIIVEGCKIKKTGTEIDTDGKIEVECITYDCTYKKVTYPFSACCNQELLEFVESIVDKKSMWRDIYLEAYQKGDLSYD
jgi:hypothetical protein